MLVNKNIIGKSQYVLPHAESYRYKLDVLTNQFGECLEVLRAISNPSQVNEYPEHSNVYHSLLARIAEYCGVKSDQIILTNGSDNALKLVLETYVTPEARTVTLVPNYPHFLSFLTSMYRGEDVRVPITLRDTVETIVAKIREALAIPTNLVYISSPNLPLGYVLNSDHISPLLADFPNTIFLVDEAYYEFSNMPVTCALLTDRPNILVTRTFSKMFGLAGLRLGYLMGRRDVVDQIRVLSNDKNVTRMAMTAGDTALANLPFYRAQLAELAECKKWLRRKLSAIPSGIIYGFRISAGNWFLLFSRKPSITAQIFADHKIFVRNKDDDVKDSVRVLIAPKRILRDVIRVVRLINLDSIVSRLHPIVDLDNTIRAGSKNTTKPYHDAIRFLSSRPRVDICTNNASYTPDEISEYLRRFVNGHIRVHSPLTFAVDEFRSRGFSRVLVVGNLESRQYLSRFSGSAPYDAVFLANNYFVDANTMLDLAIAASQGAAIYYPDTSKITSPDECSDFATSGSTRLPDVGAYAEMLRGCGYETRLLGKPNANIVSSVGTKLVVIGDSSATDGAMARELGCPWIEIVRGADCKYCFNTHHYTVGSFDYIYSVAPVKNNLEEV